MARVFSALRSLNRLGPGLQPGPQSLVDPPRDIDQQSNGEHHERHRHKRRSPETLQGRPRRLFPRPRTQRSALRLLPPERSVLLFLDVPAAPGQPFSRVNPMRRPRICEIQEYISSGAKRSLAVRRAPATSPGHPPNLLERDPLLRKWTKNRSRFFVHFRLFAVSNWRTRKVAAYALRKRRLCSAWAGSFHAGGSSSSRRWSRIALVCPSV